ncbi:unnamed protein product, partial [Tetraodon nigroviridis]
MDFEAQTEINGLFNKMKTYMKPSSGEWRVPDPNVALSRSPEKHCRLQALKASLNAVKNQLSDKNVQVWHQHTNSTNRAGKVMAAVRSAANAEVCTQAWCKFYEILGTFDLLPAEALRSGELNTVHLCEAPGAFVTALNHYLKTAESTRYCDWSWAANTLNPYHEANGGGTTIADDRLIANTLPWWFFGSDNTGDITTQNVFKPATSKAGNSEVYVVCLSYNGKEAVRPLLSKLIRNYGPRLADREALFPSSVIPETFQKQHEEVCLHFHTLQVETITENLQLFEGMRPEQRQRLDLIRDRTAQEYLQRFQVSFLPRSRWVSRNTVTPACCVAPVGRPLNLKSQTGSFNERKTLNSLSWRDRILRGRHAAWIQSHCAEAAGAACVLEGPPSVCQVDSWYRVVGAALPAVRNSPFCEVGLLNRLNEALMGADVDWTRVPPCGSCHGAPAASVLADVAGLWKPLEGQCLVFGDRSAWGPCEGHLGNVSLRFSAAPSFPEGGSAGLHDGDPRYQRRLLTCLVRSLQTLGSGDALLLPVFSALTRVTAAAVLCLHVCFRWLTFRCPPPSGAVGALLLCGGFCPPAAGRILPVLTDLLDCMARLEGEADAPQVLQFVPMEELLSRGLSEFLHSLNTEIVQQKLHRLMQ